MFASNYIKGATLGDEIIQTVFNGQFDENVVFSLQILT